MGQQYSTNLGLTHLPEIDQKESPAIYAELLRLRNALTVLQQALDKYTGALGEINPDYWNQTAVTEYTRLQNISRVYILASEPITLGQIVHFWNDAGTLKARLANATDATKPARAFCSTVDGVATGDYGEFILLGISPYVVGLTPGSVYYLNTVSGSITTTKPAVPGNVAQPIGYALAANRLYFFPEIDPPVV